MAKVNATELQLERLIETIGDKNVRAGQVSGWMLKGAEWLGLKEMLAEKMKRITMKKIMFKLEEMIPQRLHEKAGFEAEVASLLPSDFPQAFFAMTGMLGVNGLKK